MAAEYAHTDAFRGATFKAADFTSATFRDCDLTQVTMVSSEVADLQVSRVSFAGPVADVAD